MSQLAPMADTGPKCPQCECPDVKIISRKCQIGRTVQQCLCRHCGRSFFSSVLAEKPAEAAATPQPEPESPPVIYRLIHCPACDSTNTYVTSTIRPIRRHLCRGCGRRFKSFEES